MQDGLSFEWDEQKALSNLRKHGMRFQIALKVFADPDRTTMSDDRFDYGEARLITCGYIDDRLYAVVFTEDTTLKVLRMISARKANARERKRYGHREVHH